MFNDRSILGLTIETATDIIAPYGLWVVEYAGDEDTMLFPIDHQPKRINVRITHGIITEIVSRG